jgi:hypothetical protein
MSLEALKHRRLATVSAASMTIPAVLDAFWAVVDPAVITYSDGSSRAFSGTGATGCTWSRVQVGGVTEAIYATPPNGSLAQRVVIAGRSVAPVPSPTMIAPDTFLASGLLVGHQLSAGAFTTWNSATPFTNARWSGYTRLGAAVTTYTSVSVCIYESQEVIWVEMLANGTSVFVAPVGAMYDPETVTAAACETDGRRYGFITPGSSGLVTNFLGAGASGTLWAHGTAAGAPHGYVWRPGSTTIDTVSRQWTSTGAATAVLQTNLAGEFAGTPLFIPSTSGWVGRVRECYWGRPVLYHQRIDTTPGVIAAYGIGWSTTSATGDALLLKY